MESLEKERLTKLFEKVAEETFPDEYYSSLSQRYDIGKVDKSEQRKAFIKGCWTGFNIQTENNDVRIS